MIARLLLILAALAVASPARAADVADEFRDLLAAHCAEVGGNVHVPPSMGPRAARDISNRVAWEVCGSAFSAADSVADATDERLLRHCLAEARRKPLATTGTEFASVFHGILACSHYGPKSP